MSKAWFVASNRWGNANNLAKVGSLGDDKSESGEDTEREPLRRD